MTTMSYMAAFGGGADAVDALAHQVAMVLGRNDDGDALNLCWRG
jgi:hypothetical protein